MRGMLEDEATEKRNRMMKEMQEENKRLVKAFFKINSNFRLKLKKIKKKLKEDLNKLKTQPKLTELMSQTLCKKQDRQLKTLLAAIALFHTISKAYAKIRSTKSKLPRRSKLEK